MAIEESDSSAPTSDRKALEARLRAIGGGADSEIDVAEAALLIAALEEPSAPLERYEHHLSLLVRDVADEAAATGCETALAPRIQALNRIIVERYGYSGDQENYDDLQNANLLRVIDRRKGLPIALGILYVHAARAQGWTVSGLNFPGHFMLRFDLGPERIIVDPFNAGRIRDTSELRSLLKTFSGNAAELKPEHYAPMLNREILIRLQNNVKLRLMQDRKLHEAVTAIESMLMVAPERPGLWHDAGVLHAHIGNLKAAILAFDQYMALSQDAKGRQETAAFLAELRGRLN